MWALEELGSFALKYRKRVLGSFPLIFTSLLLNPVSSCFSQTCSVLAVGKFSFARTCKRQPLTLSFRGDGIHAWGTGERMGVAVRLTGPGYLTPSELQLFLPLSPLSHALSQYNLARKLGFFLLAALCFRSLAGRDTWRNLGLFGYGFHNLTTVPVFL